MRRSLGVLLALGCIVAFVPVSFSNQPPQIIKILAKKYEFVPNQIKLKKGVPVDLQFTTADKTHGFKAPALKLRTAIKAGQTATLHFVPGQTGTFPFYCDVFCGSGHDDMTGTIIVTN